MMLSAHNRASNAVAPMPIWNAPTSCSRCLLQGNATNSANETGAKNAQIPNASMKSPLMMTAAVTLGCSSGGAQGEVRIAVCFIRAPFLLPGYTFQLTSLEDPDVCR